MSKMWYFRVLYIKQFNIFETEKDNRFHIEFAGIVQNETAWRLLKETDVKKRGNNHTSQGNTLEGIKGDFL